MRWEQYRIKSDRPNAIQFGIQSQIADGSVKTASITEMTRFVSGGACRPNPKMSDKPGVSLQRSGERTRCRCGINKLAGVLTPLFQSQCWLPVGNLSPPKRLAKASASSGLAKQDTTKSLSSRRRE
jgi:hypothetical protein